MAILPHEISEHVLGGFTVPASNEIESAQKIVYQRVAKGKGNLGSIGKYGLQLRREMPRQDAKSPRQLVLRGRVREATRAWQALELEERAVWKVKADGFHYTGFNLFVQEFLKGNIMSYQPSDLNSLVMPLTGQWLYPQGLSSSFEVSNQVFSNTILFTRFGISKSTEFNAIGLYMENTAIWGNIFKIGIYGSSIDGLPESRLASSLSLNASLGNEIIHELTSSLVLDKGVYYTAFIQPHNSTEDAAFQCFKRADISGLPSNILGNGYSFLGQNRLFSDNDTDLPETASPISITDTCLLPVVWLRAA